MPKRKNDSRAVTYKRLRPTRIPRAMSTVYRMLPQKSRLTILNEVSLSTINQGNNFYDPLNIPHGTDHNDRVGHSILVSRLSFKGVIHNNASNPAVIRLVILKTDLDGAFTSSTKFLEGPTDTGVSISDSPGVDTISYPIDRQVATPIWDKTVVLPAAGGSFPNVKLVNREVRFNPPLKIKYRGGDTGAGNVFPRLHFGAWSGEADDDVAIGEICELSGVIKTFYTDA